MALETEKSFSDVQDRRGGSGDHHGGGHTIICEVLEAECESGIYFKGTFNYDYDKPPSYPRAHARTHTNTRTYTHTHT